MKYAVINNKEYFLENIYPEDNFKLHIFFLKNQNYNMGDLEDDLDNSEAIIIREDNEIICEYVGYNKVRALEKVYFSEDGFQIHAIVETIKYADIFQSIRNSVSDVNTRVDDCRYSINDIYDALNHYEDRIAELENKLKN